MAVHVVGRLKWEVGGLDLQVILAYDYSSLDLHGY